VYASQLRLDAALNRDVKEARKLRKAFAASRPFALENNVAMPFWAALEGFGLK